MSEVHFVRSVGIVFLISHIMIMSAYYGIAYGSTVEIFPINSKPYGTDYSVWTAKYWQWIMSIPAKDSPILDQSGEKCSVKQNDPNVWFLVAVSTGKVERHCVIPDGKAIFIPVLTGECDYLAVPSIKTEPELHGCAVAPLKGSIVKASIDGRELNDLQLIQSTVFDLVVTGDDSFGGGGPTGKTKAVAVGYYVFFKPLSPGKHEIKFSATGIDNPTLGTSSFAHDVTYMIEIRP